MRPPPTLFTWYGDVDPLKSRQWLIKKLLGETGVGRLAGQWGMFKTFVALDIAACVMTGQDFLGRPVTKRGGVLLFVAEGESEIAVRLRALVEHRGMKDVPFVWVSEYPALLEAGAAEKLAAITAEAAKHMQERFNLPLPLVLIDTVTASAGYTKEGQENDSSTAQRTYKVMQAISKAAQGFCLAVDHFGKNADSGTRGTSAKEDGVETLLAILGERSQSGEVSNTRLVVRKVKGAAAGDTHPFKVNQVRIGVDDDGDAIDTLTIEWSEPKKTVDRQDGQPERSATWKRLRPVLDLCLTRFGAMQQPFLDEKDDVVIKAVREEHVREEFYRTDLGDRSPEARKKASAGRSSSPRAITSSAPGRSRGRCGCGMRVARMHSRASQRGGHPGGHGHTLQGVCPVCPPPGRDRGGQMSPLVPLVPLNRHALRAWLEQLLRRRILSLQPMFVRQT